MGGGPLAVFADARVGAVPIVDDRERLVGIVSYVDLLGALRPLSRAAARRAEPEAAPRRRAPHPGRSRRRGGRQAPRAAHR